MSMVNRTFTQHLVDISQTVGEKAALKFLARGEGDPETLNFSEVNQRALTIAGHLRECGLVGCNVLLLYPSSIDYVTAFLGCLYAGVVAVPAYPPRNNRHAGRLISIIDDANVSAVLTQSMLVEKIKNQVSVEQYITTNDLDASIEPWRNNDVVTSDIAYLQYTSGSTGSPKGAMITHKNILSNCMLYAKGVGIDKGGVHVSWLPLFHDMGLVQGILLPLWLGATAVFMPPDKFVQKPVRWLKAISKYNAVMTGGPNFSYDLCVRRIKPKERENLDLRSWRVAINGAEPVLKSTLEEFCNIYQSYGFSRATFFPGYGMAEATLYVTAGDVNSKEPNYAYINNVSLRADKVDFCDESDKHAKSIVACGKVYSDIVVEIVDKNALIPSACGTVGEIWLSGDSISPGYWRKPDITNDTFNATLADYPGKRFLRTGDLGFLHNGELYITGRMKDVIIIRGENHYPQDIERLVEGLHPAFRPGGFGAVFIVDLKEISGLVVVQELERELIDSDSLDSLRSLIIKAIFEVHGLHPADILFVSPGEVSKTSSGKVQRTDCKDRYERGEFEQVEFVSMSASKVFKKIQVNEESESLVET